jgi:hypothetical protein
MKVDQVRRIALALHLASEQPHFHYASFRVGRKIFATLPPEVEHLRKAPKRLLAAQRES